MLSNNLFKIHTKFSYLTTCFRKSCSVKIKLDNAFLKCPDCNYYFCNNHLKTHKCKYICQNSTSKSNQKVIYVKCKKIICIEIFNHIKECYEGKTATSNIQPELENICELLLQLKYDIKQILIYKLSRNDFSNCDILELHIISIDELYLKYMILMSS